jgi:histidyl-tRNA synthetase
MKKPRLKFQSPTGMKDILPEEGVYFEKVYSVTDDYARFYNFQKIDQPILEDYQLFVKGTGQTTDIVEKQMYVLKTKGDEYLALRPEFTPGLARAYFEHGMIAWPHPVKLYTRGPLFRYEKPQAGRFRQFHQINFEVFGSKKPIIDVEIIWLFYNILQSLGIKNIVVQINSIGDSQCRPYYKKILVRYLKTHEHSLCATCRKRIKRNPLRVLDCKETKCQRVISQAPQIIDHLCEECHDHFEKALEYLDALEIPYILNPYLVRGLEYYTKTVFEIVPQKNDESRQNAIVGGGRYDDLLKLIGKQDIPACGGAGGVERIIALMKEEGFQIKEKKPPYQIFIAQLGDEAKIETLKLIEKFKKAKIPVQFQLSKDSLTNQLKIANKLKVKYVVIIGKEEVLKKAPILRDMETGDQRGIPREKLIKEIKKKIKK